MKLGRIAMKMLRELRTAKGISMKSLGMILGVSEGAISQYETGKRQANYETILKAADFFGVTVDYLLRGNEKPNKFNFDAPIEMDIPDKNSKEAASKFGERLKELRYERQITQKALADMFGISKSSVNMYEHGEREPSLKVLGAIADYFGVDTDYLLGKTIYRNKIAWLKSVFSYEDNTAGLTTGERMKMRRKELGLSAETIAERLGVSPATIYRYENGDIEKIPVERLTAIAHALQIPPAYLMDGRLKSIDLNSLNDKQKRCPNWTP